MKEVPRPSRGNKLIIRELNAVIHSRFATFLPFREWNAVIRSRVGRCHGAPSRCAGPFPFREPKAPWRHPRPGAPPSLPMSSHETDDGRATYVSYPQTRVNSALAGSEAFGPTSLLLHASGRKLANLVPESLFCYHLGPRMPILVLEAAQRPPNPSRPSGNLPAGPVATGQANVLMSALI